MPLGQHSTLLRFEHKRPFVYIGFVILLPAVFVTLLLAAAFSMTQTASASLPLSHLPAPLAEQRALAAYQNLPIYFEANCDQMDDSVRFVARGSGYTLTLTAADVILSLQTPPEMESSQTDFEHFQMTLVGSNPHPLATGQMLRASTSSYFRGSDPAQWITAVPHYAQVYYTDVYPGIDLTYHGKQGQLQYDFILAPDTNPGQIRITFPSVDDLELDANGDLVLHLDDTIIRQQAPFTYQEVGGNRREVASRFILLEDRQIGFEIGDYDPALPLVIDPTIIYSTLIDGTLDQGKRPTGIAVDDTGAAYITGVTTGYPPYYYPLEYIDVYVIKLDPAGNLVFSIVLEGAKQWFMGGWTGNVIAVDSEHAVYVTGSANSPNFPTTPGAYVASDLGTFVTKIAATGDSLVYSAIIGEGNYPKIAIDAGGVAYVTGSATSGLPVTPDAFDTTSNGSGDAFILKLSAAGDAITYCTFLGGSGNDLAVSLSVDSDLNMYVMGYTGSADFPTTPGSFDPTFNGGTRDYFVTKLFADGSSLAYSTFIGGSADEETSGDMALGPDDTVYIVGATESVDFPTTAGAYDTVSNGQDAVIVRLTADGSALVYSTLLGGSDWEYGEQIAVDATGTVYVTGLTASDDFPMVDAFQPERLGDPIGFVAKLNPAGSALLHSSTFGDSDYYQAYDIAVDANQDAYLVAKPTVFPGGEINVFKISDSSTTYTVTTTADSGPGSLRQAILDANANSGTDTIDFALSTPAVIVLAGTLPDITDDVIIDGPGADQLAVDGNDQHQVFYITSGVTLEMHGITVRRGFISGYGTAGAGMFIDNGTLNASNCVLAENRATYGGAIRNEGGVIDMTGCEFRDNGNHYGGGIYNSYGTVTLNRVSFIDNHADNTSGGGGGIYNLSGTAVLTDCTFTGNSSENGGAIYNSGTMTVLTSTLADNYTTSSMGAEPYWQQGGAILNAETLTLIKSTLSGNVSGLGGGLAIWHGTVTLVNSTLSGNTAASGGGIYHAANSSPASLDLINSTLAENTAAIGGSIHSYGYNATATLTVTNSILVSGDVNCFSEGDVVSNDGGHNLMSDTSCGFGQVAAPLLGPLADNGGPTLTHLPQSGSPAIDAGDDAVCAADPVNGLDQRGTLRPQDGNGDGTPICDIGAVEYTIAPPANQPPVNVVPGSQLMEWNTVLDFGSMIQTSDPDADDQPVQVALTVTDGALTLSGTTGLAFSVGDGTGDAAMTFTGPLTDINIALNGLTYTPPADFLGDVTLTITTDDQGHTGAGGAQSDTDSVTIHVTLPLVGCIPVPGAPGQVICTSP